MGNRSARIAKESAEFAADVNLIKARLRSQGRWLIDPKGSFVQYKDMATTFAMLWTIFVTPYEVGLDMATTFNGLFVLNILIGLIFLFDLVCQFILPVPLKASRKSDKVLTQSFERRHYKLAQNYLSSWFLLDVVTIIPFDILVWQGVFQGEVKIIKVLRVLRLLKVAKILRASTIIQRWENSFAIPSTKQALGSFVFGTFILLHWLACAWSLLSTLQTPQRIGVEAELEVALEALLETGPECAHFPSIATSNLDAVGSAFDGYASVGCLSSDASPSNALVCASACLSPCEREALARIQRVSVDFIFHSEPWTCRAATVGTLSSSFSRDPFEVYTAALLVAMLQIVGGVSTITPTQRSEYIVFFFAILCGTVLLSAVQGVICGVVTNGDPDEIAWRQKLDSLNFMMADTSMPQRTRLQVRGFFRKSKRLFKRRTFDVLIGQTLSTQLQRDVRYQIASAVFQGVWWLRDCERDFLEDLSVRVRRIAYGPQDRIFTEDTLTIITHGMASRGGVLLSVGAFFGDIIITSQALRDTTRAKALSYCEVARISRADMYEVLVDYPGSQHIIKQAGLRLALARAVTIISVYVHANTVNRSAKSFKRLVARKEKQQEEGGEPSLFRQERQRSLVGLTGGLAIGEMVATRPSAVLQTLFGAVLGQWREIEHVGKDLVIIEPDTDGSDPTGELIAMFQRYDVDGSGAIDVDELKLALGDLGFDAERDEASVLLARFDKNGTGLCEFNEFRKLIKQLRTVSGDDCTPSTSFHGGSLYGSNFTAGAKAPAVATMGVAGEQLAAPVAAAQLAAMQGRMDERLDAMERQMGESFAAAAQTTSRLENEVRALINLVMASPGISGNAGNGNGKAGAAKGGLAKARRDRLAKAAENGGTSSSSSQGPPPLPGGRGGANGLPPPLPPSHLGAAQQPARSTSVPPPAVSASRGASQLSMAAQQPPHSSEYSQLHDSRSEVAEARRDFEDDAAQELPTKEAPSRSRERPQSQPHGRTGVPSAALPPLPPNQPPPLPSNQLPPALPPNANRPPPLPSNQLPPLPPTRHLAPLAAEMVRAATVTGGSAGSRQGHRRTGSSSSVSGEGSEAASMHDLSLEA